VTQALLVLLNVQLLGVLLYAYNEWRSASHYRKEHLQIREDDLVYQDLLARLHMRNGRRPIVASAREHRQPDNSHSNGHSVKLSHVSSFPGWDK
jgi:hypothetical protein